MSTLASFVAERVIHWTGTSSVFMWLAAELHGALVRKALGDTHTEMLRPFIHIHPVIWCATLGLWAGVVFWITVHLWWGWK